MLHVWKWIMPLAYGEKLEIKYIYRHWNWGIGGLGGHSPLMLMETVYR